MRFWKNNRPPLWLWGALAGVLFLGAGMALKQFGTIWQKAVMICMECIGIG